jgi:hypothetical protein
VAAFVSPPPRRIGPAEKTCFEVEKAFLQGYSLGTMLPVEALAGQVAGLPVELHPFVWEGVGAAMAARPEGTEGLKNPLWQTFLQIGRGIAASEGDQPPARGWALEGFGYGVALYRPRQLSSFPVSPAFDHGVGRALWLLSGGDPAHARRLLRMAPERSHAWRWRGLGFAAIFVGGGPEHRVELLRLGATPHGSQVEEGARQGRALRMLWRGGSATLGVWPWEVSDD